MCAWQQQLCRVWDTAWPKRAGSGHASAITSPRCLPAVSFMKRDKMTSFQYDPIAEASAPSMFIAHLLPH